MRKKKVRYITRSLNKIQFEKFLNYFFMTTFFTEKRGYIFEKLRKFELVKHTSDYFGNSRKFEPWKIKVSPRQTTELWVFVHRSVVLKVYFDKNSSLQLKAIFLKESFFTAGYLWEILRISNPIEYAELLRTEAEEAQLNEILKSFTLVFNA